jgi:hypothetical protein
MRGPDDYSREETRDLRVSVEEDHGRGRRRQSWRTVRKKGTTREGWGHGRIIFVPVVSWEVLPKVRFNGPANKINIRKVIFRGSEKFGNFLVKDRRVSRMFRRGHQWGHDPGRGHMSRGRASHP